MSEKMEISFCRFKGGDYEFIIQKGDKRTVIVGKSEYLSEEDIELLEDIAPPCVFTAYKEIEK